MGFTPSSCAPALRPSIQPFAAADRAHAGWEAAELVSEMRLRSGCSAARVPRAPAAAASATCSIPSSRMASTGRHERSQRWNEKSSKRNDSLDRMPRCGLRSPTVPIDERLSISADPASSLGRGAPGIAALLLLLLAGSSSAWGPDGHRITGEIAWRSLSPKTKAAIVEVLPDGRYDTLAEAATWADTYARQHPREYRWLDPFHFVNTDPRAEHVIAGPRCECVVAAIGIHADRLRNPNGSRDSKIEALRLLAHFVGDVHQPLHVSHPDARGGTTIDLRFAGDPMTLHRLWDSALLERRLRERRRARSARWRGFAHSLGDSADAAERARWTASLDPLRWADESLALSKQPVFAVRRDAALDDAYYGSRFRSSKSGSRKRAFVSARCSIRSSTPAGGCSSVPLAGTRGRHVSRRDPRQLRRALPARARRIR